MTIYNNPIMKKYIQMQGDSNYYSGMARRAADNLSVGPEMWVRSLDTDHDCDCKHEDISSLQKFTAIAGIIKQSGETFNAVAPKLTEGILSIMDKASELSDKRAARKASASTAGETGSSGSLGGASTASNKPPKVSSSDLRSSASSASSNIEEAIKNYEKYGDSASLITARADAKAQLAAYQTDIDNNNELKTKNQAIIDGTPGKIGKCNENIEAANAEVKKAQDDIDAKEKDVTDYENGEYKAAIDAKNEFEKSSSEALASIDKQIAEAKANGQDTSALESQKSEKEQEIANKRREIYKKVTDAQTELDSKKATLKEAKDKFPGIQEDARDAITAQKKEIESLKKQKADAESNIKTLDSNNSKLENAKSSVQKSIEKADDALRNLELGAEKPDS